MFLHIFHYIALEKGTVSFLNMLSFTKGLVMSAKVKDSWNYKVYFLKQVMCFYLRTECQISSIIQTPTSTTRLVQYKMLDLILRTIFIDKTFTSRKLFKSFY